MELTCCVDYGGPDLTHLTCTPLVHHKTVSNFEVAFIDGDIIHFIRIRHIKKRFLRLVIVEALGNISRKSGSATDSPIFSLRRGIRGCKGSYLSISKTSRPGTQSIRAMMTKEPMKDHRKPIITSTTWIHSWRRLPSNTTPPGMSSPP